ncbi:MAG TPA: helix-turn-helix domain-containing protein [Solirubrobacteraceae bacterium]|nr:helix-turn-helix domain-containing protein [Solirubrobacteraceae bacterium]
MVGLVIVEGVLCREVSLRDHTMFELLGPGDVVQPPVQAGRPGLGGSVKLTAVSDMTLVVLGESFIRAAAQWPSLLAAVQRRVEAQRESLAIQGLIAHLPRAEHRLLLILWHLAERWGYVTPEGIVLPLALTHDLLGQLIGARRSTTTLALRALESDGLLRRTEDGSWLLTAAAERRVDAITHTPDTEQVLGERVMLCQRLSDTRAEALALRAEARQIRGGRRARGTDYASR